jgi:putative aldouronate transport system permease protein
VIDFEAYRQIFMNPQQLIDSYTTTIIFSAITTVLSVLIMALMAYPLSRPNYKLKGLLTFYIFFTMLFGGGLVPSYIINTKYLHLDNTIWIYIFPSLVSAWSVIIIRTFFQGLPGELVESAKIDGAAEIRIFFQIIMPLSKPVLATMAFMVVIGKWNDWNTALIYIKNPKLYSLQYMLQKILREADFVQKMAQQSAQFVNYKVPTESMRYAMAILAAGPMLIVFPFFQKYFAKGLTIGAVKG